jgi:hypothetical protein
MTTPTNILQQVQTYQRSNLALLQNQSPFVATANTKFKDFEKIVANLGSSVTFDLPPRFTTTGSLVATFQAANQRVQTLTVNQAANTSYAFSAQERIFNVDKDVEPYMAVYGRSAVAELGTLVESNLALNAISAVTDPATFLPDPTSGPFRFFGDGLTPINSFTQLAQMIANFKNFGAVREGIKVYLSDLMIPNIVGTGLNQFAPRRNDEISMSWEVGEFGTPPVEYFQSNLLATQIAGNVGNNQSVMTVVATNDPTGQYINTITFSGATANDPNAIAYGDMFQFQDNVSGFPNLRYLTFIGHVASGQPVQNRVTSSAGSNGIGHVTVTLANPLVAAAGPNQNITTNIVAGMQVKFLPSHRAGLVVGGDALFLGMPRLPDQYPYPTAAEYDEHTGVSLRMTYGSLFGQNQTGMIHDCVWGSTLVPEYSLRIAIPL